MCAPSFRRCTHSNGADQIQKSNKREIHEEP
jgi:hypothetical protein